MSFELIAFLFGGLAIAGPIAAHLFARPRYRRIPFTMLRFLQAGQRESQSRRRFRDLLLLLLRCLAIASIVLMFAGPRVLANYTRDTTRPLHVLGLDDSLSMAAQSGGATHFARMKEKALDYINSAGANDVFSVYALASGARTDAVDAEQARGFIATLSGPVAAPFQPGEFVAAVRAAGSDARQSKTLPAVFVASDFTPAAMEAFAPTGQAAPVRTLDYSVVADEKAPNNVCVVAARVTNARNGRLGVDVTLQNYGATPQHRELHMKAADTTLPSVAVDLAPGDRRIVTVAIPQQSDGKNGATTPLELRLNEGDALTEDDVYYVALTAHQDAGTKVTVVSTDEQEGFLPNTALKTIAAMDELRPVTVTSVTLAQYSDAALRANVVLFTALPSLPENGAEALTKFVKEGGKAVFFVPKDTSAQTLLPFVDARLIPAQLGAMKLEPARINPKATLELQTDPLSMDGIALAALRNYGLDRVVLTGYRELQALPDAQALWRLDTGEAFVYYASLGAGATILVNTSADDTLGDLMKSPATVAFVDYLLGRSGQVKQLAYRVGESGSVAATDAEVKSSTTGLTTWIVTPSGEKEKAPIQDGQVQFRIAKDLGWVRTTAEPIRWAGINLPLGETDLSAPSAPAVDDLLSRLFSKEAQQSQQQIALEAGMTYNPLWQYFGWLAIGFILIEAFVANRFKR